MEAQKKERVLIALEYDPTAQKVAEEGFSKAKTRNAEVILLHVITEPVYYSTIGYSPVIEFTDSMEKRMKQLEELEAKREATSCYLDCLKLHLGDESITSIIKEGDSADSILKTASDLQADIIVMGSHSCNGKGKTSLLSVTQKVKQLATIPIYIVSTKK